MKNRQLASVVIATYGRERVLLETLGLLLALDNQAAEILVVDQTPNHESETEEKLRAMNARQLIRWIRMDEPSIPKAMNKGLVEAKHPLVLFLDDDVIPSSGLVREHALYHVQSSECWVTAGQVIQPWQSAEVIDKPNKGAALRADLDFPFNTTVETDVSNVIGCNFCVKRDRAIDIGGFDEAFIGSSYRFETEFARRVIQAGGRIRFVPDASIYHLRASSGGTRRKGAHMASASPLHGFGDYYYAFRHASRKSAYFYGIRRVFREVRTRFHLTHPWWIPAKLIGEIRALMMARKAVQSPPKLISFTQR